MCSEPMMRRPLSGCLAAYSSRTAIRPGISCSASMISLRPHSASARLATLNSRGLAELFTVGLFITRVMVFLSLVFVSRRQEQGRAFGLRLGGKRTGGGNPQSAIGHPLPDVL